MGQAERLVGTAGFTLVEFLVALVLVGLLSGLMTVFLQQFSALTRIRTDAAVELELRALVRHLETTIGAAMPLPLIDPDNQRRVFLDGGPSRLRLVATVPLGLRSSALREVELGLDGGDGRTRLAQRSRLRRVRPLPDDVPAAEDVLMEDVTALRFRYLRVGGADARAEWLDHWSAEAALPRAVRLQVEISRDDRTYKASGLARLPPSPSSALPEAEALRLR